jgi:putative flippase GtrA
MYNNQYQPDNIAPTISENESMLHKVKTKVRTKIDKPKTKVITLFSPYYQKFTNLLPWQKQIIKFGIIGVAAVMVDLFFYYIFLSIFPEKFFKVISNEAVAKTLSFLCGMTVTYFSNKFWTWKQNNRSNRRLFKFGVLYGMSLLINVSTNLIVLFSLREFVVFSAVPYKYFIAFLAATCTSALFNFVGQKYWVFKTGE